MLRHPGHPSLCFFHSREERQQLELDRIGEDLASLSTEFHTMTEVRRAVAQLFKLVARNRIPLGNARLLAYLAQLLVYSQPDARQEIKFAFGHDGWNQVLRAAFSAPSGSDPGSFSPAMANKMSPLAVSWKGEHSLAENRTERQAVCL
jgi:hypothetical protein